MMKKRKATIRPERSPIIGLAIAIAQFAFASGVLCAEEHSKEGIEFFEKKIRPVLVEHCYSCHSAKADPLQGSLALDTRKSTRAGGDSGPSVVPKDLESSLIIDALKYESFEMPPKGKLPDNVIRDFETWVKMGAPDPRDGEAVVVKGIDIEAAREFWAFQPVTSPSIPPVTNTPWPQDSIDHFVLAKLESAGLQPAADANRFVWLRRVTFDLAGRPPSLEEIDAFVADTDSNAFEKVVDRLIESKEFGQRWGRHWLDVARYADSNGADFNLTFHNAWRYRDYIIKSFNDDKPFDQLIREQVAGDLLPAEDDVQRTEQIVATGFLALGAKMLSERDKEKLRMDVIDEQLDTIGKAFLGMTIGCARCHDHKFDPIPTKDYYGMAGIFRSTKTLADKERQRFVSDWLRLPLPVSVERKAAVDAHNKDVSAATKSVKSLEKSLAALKKDLAAAEKTVKATSAEATEADGENGATTSIKHLKSKVEDATEALKSARAELAKLKNNAPLALPRAIAVEEHDDNEIGDYKIAIRGNPKRLGGVATRSALTVVDVEALKIPDGQSGRLQLAEWIADENNPLTSRVAVNRVWHHLFGRGIVSSTDNFGKLGQRPTHPKLLDYLADDFVKNGWSFKKLIRKIVLSRTYRMSSEYDAIAVKKDPENQLFWRMNRKRLDAEAIRDAMLFVSGKTHPMDGGTAVDSLSDKAGPIDTEQWNRRSVYLPIVRSNIVPMLEMFDFANAEMVTGDRSVTTVPSQSLILMNSPFIMDQSKAAAQKVLSDNSANNAERISRIYKVAICRTPEPSELERSLSFIESFEQSAHGIAKGDDAARKMAWSAFCQALIASTEFRFID